MIETWQQDLPHGIQLSCREGWAAAYPQSAYLLREEVIAWQKTPWSLELEGIY